MKTPAQDYDAFQLTITDPAVRAYLQRYPFATGPDSAMNAHCRQEIGIHLAVRPRPRMATRVVRLKPDETRLAAEEIDRLERILDESEVPQAARAEMINDFAWEANLVPRDVKDVLVIGCGNGEELMFLRAVLPETNITALDYTDSVPPARKRATGVRFFQGDMQALLSGFGQEFDLISSNHTLEHLYMPNEVLTTLAKILRPHGALISVLPMDGWEHNPFLAQTRDMATKTAVYPLDVVYLDAGHPWKTNPDDLNATLQEVGFEPPQFYQREEHLSRCIKGNEKQLKTGLAIGKMLHLFAFRLPRSLMKLLFPQTPPNLLSKCMLAAERRVWFGTNRLKNTYTPEILILAQKRSSTASLDN